VSVNLWQTFETFLEWLVSMAAQRDLKHKRGIRGHQKKLKR
jgi:hypothetical protein